MNKKRLLIALGMILTLGYFAFNNQVKVVNYYVKNHKTDKSLKIALMTDFHSCDYGKDTEEIMVHLNKIKPDLILLGGDIFDDRLDNHNARRLIENISPKYPCYYVSGNHEVWSKEYDEIIRFLREHEVVVLENQIKHIRIEGVSLNIAGIEDPSNVRQTSEIYMKDQLERLSSQVIPSDFSILLSHRPEYAEVYQNYNFDLVTAGHAHGGQWRIPYVLNGLFAPNQGLFPKYAGGLYHFLNQDLIVSRGLARESTRVPRIFNQPEIVVINLN